MSTKFQHFLFTSLYQVVVFVFLFFCFWKSFKSVENLGIFMGLWGANTREWSFSQVRDWVDYLHFLPRCQQQWGSVVCWLSNKNINKNKPLKTRSKRSDSLRCFIFRKTKHTYGRTWANALTKTDYSLPLNHVTMGIIRKKCRWFQAASWSHLSCHHIFDHAFGSQE